LVFNSAHAVHVFPFVLIKVEKVSSVPQRYTQLKDQLPVSRLTLNVLLALRLMYDDVNDVVKLESDVEELNHFPERLSDSYRAEWESYVRRALVNEFKQHGDASPATFIASIMERVEAVQASNPRYAALMPIIERAQQVNHTENTHLFPSPWRQQIMALLLPVTAVTPPDKDNS
tara:strand:+ start:1495 stop:2016 length:522 start_codon:yes stop_codon:yes gene_type:complete